MAYWPQKQVTYFLKNAHTASIVTGYDSKAFFATDHPVNPLNTGLGSYYNIFTSSSSGSYPGACPIDDSIDDDDALVNLSKIFAYIATIKMPNGEDPRFLRPKAILCGPRMFPRVVQLTSAKFIAKTAGSGAGSADVEALIKAIAAYPQLAGYLLDAAVEQLRANPDLIVEVVPAHYKAVAKAHASELVELFALNAEYMKNHPALLSDALKAWQS